MILFYARSRLAALKAAVAPFTVKPVLRFEEPEHLELIELMLAYDREAIGLGEADASRCRGGGRHGDARFSHLSERSGSEPLYMLTFRKPYPPEIVS